MNDRTWEAQKTLGNLSGMQPVIIVDTREQEPLAFHHFKSIRGSLRAGDYSFCGGENLMAVERKSLADMISCCSDSNRYRFEWELHRLTGFSFRRLLIVGARAEVEGHMYRSRIKPQAVFGSLGAWEARYAVPVVWSPSPEEAAEQVETWAWWMSREIVRNASRLLTATKGANEDSRGAVGQGTGAEGR